MKIAPAVKKETGHIALGTAVGVAVMLVVFAVLGYFSAGVAVSGILGGALAVGNFFLLGLTVQKMADGQPEDRARKWMQFSYNMRMLLMVVWLIVALAVRSLIKQKKSGGVKIKEETAEDSAKKLFQMLSDASII